MSLYTFDQLPTTSGAAIREFQDRYLAAQGVTLPPAWVDEFGDVGPVNSPMVTFPISQLSGQYKETVGDSKFKSMKESSFDVKVIEYDEGYKAKLMDLFLNVWAYRKWTEAASRFTVAEAVHRAKSIATILEAGASTPLLWEDPAGGVNFFDAAHPANFADSSVGTWSNYQSAAKDPNSIPNIIAEQTLMMAAKDENGQKLGVDPDVIMLPTAKYKLVDSLLKQSLVAVATGTGAPGGGTATMNNPLQGLRAVHNPQLTDADDWYLIDSKLVRMLPPWACLRFSPGPALELRVFDESSDHFKRTGELMMSSHIWYGFANVFPHAIRLVKGA